MNRFSLGADSSGRAGLGFLIGAAAILGALGFEYLGGYLPCELCLGQRVPYYVGLPILALTLILWQRLPALPRLGLTLLVGAIFLWGFYLGAYHAGVEWGFWPGPTACTGTGDGLSFNDLNNLDAARVVPCDQPQLRIIGISLAGYNALISGLVVVLLLWSAMGQWQTRTQKA